MAESAPDLARGVRDRSVRPAGSSQRVQQCALPTQARRTLLSEPLHPGEDRVRVQVRLGDHVRLGAAGENRKSTRLNSSHGYISYAVFCLKKKKKKNRTQLQKKKRKKKSTRK